MLMAAGLVLLSLGSCQKEDYKIQSNPDEFAVFPLAIPVAAEGGEYTVNITGHENWTISYGEANTTNTDWVTLSQTSGSGAAEIKVTVTQSTSFVKNRQLILEVKNETKTLRSKVIQKTLTLKDNEILIKGKVWATANLNTPGVFCESPDEIGMYYQFNSKKPWPSSGKIEGWSVDKDVFATKGWVEDAWFPENDPCPEGWRVPTYVELDELIKHRSSWTNDDKSHKGYWFSAPYSYASFFFPAAGFRRNNDGDDLNRGNHGFYWSSRPGNNGAYNLFFSKGNIYMNYNYRAYGYSVRCVQITDEVAEL